VSTLGLERLAGRCSHGYAACQPCPDCGTTTEWATFTAALARAVRGGLIHQSDMRPLLRGRVEPRHVGQCYARAKREGLIVEVAREVSDDTAGRNTNKWEPIYELRTRS
jgi:hypothetical protein